MTRQPEKWSDAQLEIDAGISAADFRRERLLSSDAWGRHVESAQEKFDLLLRTLNDLDRAAITDDTLGDAFRRGLGEALRYLAGPPISEDDLKVIADVESLAPSTLARDPESRRKVFQVIEDVLDLYRFPWTARGSHPTEEERESALLSSAVLLAAQRVATERRSHGKSQQERSVRDHLTTMGLVEVAPEQINTIVRGPQAGEFCAECMLGARKADIVVRLFDTRLLAIECKVSNSATNSVKRLNNDAAVKAEYWLKQFGSSQVVPVAVLSGVFKVLNLSQAQDRGLALFWRHDLAKLGDFIRATGGAAH